MTEQQYKNAQDVLRRVADINNAISEINRFVKRIEEITGPYQKDIKIQIAEQYVNTPIAKVNLENFLEFIATEKALLEMKKQALEKEFEDI